MAGEQYKFYINSDYPLTEDLSGTGMGLGLINRRGAIVVPAFTTFNIDAYNAGEYRILLTFNFPIVPAGIYRLALYDTLDNDKPWLVSNELEVITTERAIKETVLLEYYNSDDLYFYTYATGSQAAFTNKIRLHLRMSNYDPDVDITQYQAVNTGRLRNVKTSPREAYQFETGFFDLAAHRAANILALHDHIIINGSTYIAKSKYESNYDAEYPLTKGIFELYEQQFNFINIYKGIEDIKPVVDGTFDSSFDLIFD